MNIDSCIQEQAELHPAMQAQDVIKLCYQAAFGAEHLLFDLGRAWTYFKSEFDSVAPREGMLYEAISSAVCRVNIAVWKARGLPPEWLFRLFTASCRISENGKAQFAEYIAAAEALIMRGGLSISPRDWNEFIAEYKRAGMPPIHHSDEYRERELPAYRIVSRRFCDCFSLLEAMARGEATLQNDADEQIAINIALGKA